MEPLKRLCAGLYITKDKRFSIKRLGKAWLLSAPGGYGGIATCNTKLSAEVILSRKRALESGLISQAEYETETERWRG